MARVALKEHDAFDVCPAAAQVKPEGQRKVVERNHRADASIAQAANHLAVAVERLMIEAAGIWLYAAPFDAESVGIEAQSLHQIKVIFGVLPPVAGEAALITVVDCARLLLEVGPLVVAVATFVLVCRGGCAPEEIWRESQGLCHGLIDSHGLLFHNFICGEDCVGATFSGQMN